MSICEFCGCEFDLNEEGGIIDGEPCCDDCLMEVEDNQHDMRIAA